MESFPSARIAAILTVEKKNVVLELKIILQEIQTIAQFFLHLLSNVLSDKISQFVGILKRKTKTI